MKSQQFSLKLPLQKWLLCMALLPSAAFAIDAPLYVLANVCISDAALEASIECYGQQGLTLEPNKQSFVSDPARIVENTFSLTVKKNGAPCRHTASVTACNACMKVGTNALKEMVRQDKKVNILRDSIKKALKQWTEFQVPSECENPGSH